MKARSFVVLFDLLFAIGFALYLVYQSKADPGDIALLWALENYYMMGGYVLFAITVLPVLRYFRIKSRNANQLEIKGQDDKRWYTFLFEILVLVGLVIAIGGFIIVILDEIMIGFFIEYLKANGYYFESLEILDSDSLFFEDRKMRQMSSLFNFDKNELFLIFGIRYFIELVVLYVSNGRFIRYSAEDFRMKGTYLIAVHAFTGPVIALFAMLVLVILTLFFQPQAWIVIVALVIFKLCTTLVLWFYMSSDKESQEIEIKN
jgi:hypothetical protein